MQYREKTIDHFHALYHVMNELQFSTDHNMY